MLAWTDQRGGWYLGQRSLDRLSNDSRLPLAATSQAVPAGLGWQRGHECDDRFMNDSRRIAVPHRGHGRPC